MEKLNLKRKHYIILALVVIMIFTNPSRSSFISYLHYSESNGTGRDFNGLIFSVYSDSNSIGTGRYPAQGGYEIRRNYKDYYIGFLGNFIKVHSTK